MFGSTMDRPERASGCARVIGSAGRCHRQSRAGSRPKRWTSVCSTRMTTWSASISRRPPGDHGIPPARDCRRPFTPPGLADHRTHPPDPRPSRVHQAPGTGRPGLRSPLAADRQAGLARAGADVTASADREVDDLAGGATRRFRIGVEFTDCPYNSMISRDQVKQPRQGLLVVISGPSGVGKDTVLRRLFELAPHLKYSVSYTTRPPRPGEVDGHSYTFVSEPEFLRLIEQ